MSQLRCSDPLAQVSPGDTASFNARYPSMRLTARKIVAVLRLGGAEGGLHKRLNWDTLLPRLHRKPSEGPGRVWDFAQGLSGLYFVFISEGFRMFRVTKGYHALPSPQPPPRLHLIRGGVSGQSNGEPAVPSSSNWGAQWEQKPPRQLASTSQSTAMERSCLSARCSAFGCGFGLRSRVTDRNLSVGDVRPWHVYHPNR